MTKLKVFSFMEVGTKFGFTTVPFLDEFWDWEKSEKTQKIPELIIFGGGQDIATEMYGAKPILSWIPHKMSDRDRYEKDLFEYGVQHNIPMLGICRGAQLLCALNGGSLFQDVSRHGRDHKICALEDKYLFVTSCHHQMMIPPKDGEILAWGEEHSTRRYHKESCNLHIPLVDPEAVFFSKTKSLSVQWHPEYNPNSVMGEYTRDLVNNLLLKV